MISVVKKARHFVCLKKTALIIGMFSGLLVVSCSKSSNKALQSNAVVLGTDTSIARPGDTVRLLGTGFSTAAGVNHVTIEGIEVKLINISATSIAFIVPSGVSSGKVTLLISGGPSYNVDRPLKIIGIKDLPTILSIDPVGAEPGKILTLKAKNFSTLAVRNGLSFSGIPARIVSVDASTILAVYPGGNLQTRVVLTAEGNGASFPYAYLGSELSPLLPDGRIYYTAPDATQNVNSNGFNPAIPSSIGLYRTNDKNTLPGGRLAYSLGSSEYLSGGFFASNFSYDTKGGIYYTSGQGSTDFPLASFPQLIIRYDTRNPDPATARSVVAGTIPLSTVYLSGYSCSYGDQVYFGTDSTPSNPVVRGFNTIPQPDPRRRVLAYKLGDEASTTVNFFLPEPSLVFAVARTKLYYVTGNPNAYGSFKYTDLANPVPRDAANSTTVQGITAFGNISPSTTLNTFLLTQPSKGDSIILFDRDQNALGESRIILYAAPNAFHGEVNKVLYDTRNFPFIRGKIDAMRWVNDHLYFTFSKEPVGLLPTEQFTSVCRINDDGSSPNAKIIYTRLEPFVYPRSRSLLYINPSEK